MQRSFVYIRAEICATFILGHFVGKVVLRTDFHNISRSQPMTEARYPELRMRRLRQSAFIRDLVQEHRLHKSDLIWPLFVCEGDNITEDIAAMPEVKRYSVDRIVMQAQMAVQLGLPAVALFPKTPEQFKDADGSQALNRENLVCQAVRAVKSACPDLGIICDVALDPYTDHGHDGVLDQSGRIVNDKTVEILVEQACLLAESGCNIIAPSDMMDGRIGAIRSMLEKDGHHDTLILSYAAKYASAFYGPFRDAVGAARKLGDDGKKTYQMNPANSAEALREVRLDIAEGADMVMVKPGLPYLDIIQQVTTEFSIPCLAYQVSGEYAMMQAAVKAGWLDKQAVVFESLTALKRAGACAVFSYFAPYVAELLEQ